MPEAIKFPIDYTNQPYSRNMNVHCWFGDTYAQYLTIPRSVLQAMPLEWQARIVRCLEELDGTFDWRPKKKTYWVSFREYNGRYSSIATDPLMSYRHPDRDHLRAILKPRLDIPKPLGWKCSCGWKGFPLDMNANPSGSLVCPDCGGSGALVSELDSVM